MGDTVTVNAPVTYDAWLAPNHATMDVSGERPAVAVADLAPHALDALAQQWLDHLYASVGRKSPFVKQPESHPEDHSHGS